MREANIVTLAFALLMVVFVLGLTACSGGGVSGANYIEGTSVQVVRDTTRGVTCYIYSGISCVKTS